MLMAIDVGNTNTVVALYNETKMLRHWRMATDKNRASDEIGMLLLQFLGTEQITAKDIEAVIISSVVPPIMHALNNAVRRYVECEPMIVGPGTKTDMQILYDNPKEVGADRIVNAVAAIHKYGKPLIIVDFGTATTFCAIDRQGDYLGGVITPGVKIAMDALFEQAAKLPRVEIKKPPRVIGKNTVASMQSGAVFGQVAQVDGIVGRMKAELNAPDCKVIATGGLAGTIAEESQTIDVVDRMLTLDGLRILYEKNC
ncbi:type III pantothenate kinase [Ructibacterium gallinarum]|uniref:Type III pantothenate kinase n=1 Tax=Ructibacterium gallinarum TaxID=2779355 RepID=A0A9D5M3F8_9FIRM|nr:type III pantothenate kinase [Ructibacterium gallinarum]MBE5039974.1 type III pantothenate kinase [Ructibacterium gallinarum]